MTIDQNLIALEAVTMRAGRDSVAPPGFCFG